VRVHCALDAAGQILMKSAMRKSELQMSARGFHHVLARTIADLVGSDVIKAEGLQSGGGDAIQTQTTGELGVYNHCYPDPRGHNHTLSSNHG